MDSNERWQIEEAHDDNVRALNEAEEALNDYRQRASRRTDELVEMVYSVYRQLPNTSNQRFGSPFEQTISEYNFEIQKAQQKLEEDREAERRDFNNKLEA
ncbi:MAG: hypothetical protein LBI13_03810 [Streptococcaceae bacterium]|jgi:hypothetical protein|nr:hypothetical protein [Streptococcaceae bacterium]